MTQKYYHGFFKETIVPRTKVTNAASFENDYILTEEVFDEDDS